MTALVGRRQPRCVEGVREQRHVIDDLGALQALLVRDCRNAELLVESGKASKVTLENCQDVNLVIDEVVVGVELLRCHRVLVRTPVRCDSYTVDLSTDCEIHTSVGAPSARTAAPEPVDAAPADARTSWTLFASGSRGVRVHALLTDRTAIVRTLPDAAVAATTTTTATAMEARTRLCACIRHGDLYVGRCNLFGVATEPIADPAAL